MAPPPPVGRLGLLLPPILGLAAIVAGVVLLRASPVSFGWFAYAPLTETTFAPGLPGAWTAGLLLLLAGVATVAAWAGYLAGRRRRG